MYMWAVVSRYKSEVGTVSLENTGDKWRVVVYAGKQWSIEDITETEARRYYKTYVALIETLSPSIILLEITSSYNLSDIRDIPLHK